MKSLQYETIRTYERCMKRQTKSKDAVKGHRHGTHSNDVLPMHEPRMSKRVLLTTLVVITSACTFGSIVIVKQSTPVSQHRVHITASYRTRFSSHDPAYSLPTWNDIESPQPIPKILHNVYLDGRQCLHHSMRLQSVATDAFQLASAAELFAFVFMVSFYGFECCTGLDNLKIAESTVGAQPGQSFPGYNSSWRQSCHEMHDGWKYMFWDMTRAESLIQTAYPWFLATFQSYKNNVQKGKVL